MSLGFYKVIILAKEGIHPQNEHYTAYLHGSLLYKDDA